MFPSVSPRLLSDYNLHTRHINAVPENDQSTYEKESAHSDLGSWEILNGAGFGNYFNEGVIFSIHS